MIKLFNPVGAIPVAKIDMMKKMFKVNSTDTPWAAEGKLNALEVYSKQALKRAEDRQKLLFEHDGFPPPDKLAALDSENAASVDAILDLDFTGKPIEDWKAQNLPDPTTKARKTLTNPTTGQKVYSDGIKWVIR